MIERQNILELIGRNKSKYTSCIITSYTFDFSFFEERIMSILRISNIKNVNVFIDGKYLENYLENSVGTEFKTHKTYSLNPVYTDGIFHPKIMLLTGPKHGLLVIGSGNLTSSGLSTNDEIWSAFHLNSIESENAPIFSAVWNYLKQFLLQTKGFNTQKIAWITQRSPWLSEISTMTPNGFIQIKTDLEVMFIGNSNVSNTYAEINKALPKVSVNNMTIISPYFDENGIVLERFIEDYKIKQITCITDIEFGLPPVKLNDKSYGLTKFYDWKDCLKDFDKRFNRLHAKIFHFEYSDGWEYLYIGSANATLGALGKIGFNAKNAEAGLILKRKSQKGFVTDLGIHYKNAKLIDIRSVKRNATSLNDLPPVTKFEAKILYVEKNGNRLHVFLKTKLKSECSVTILNSTNSELENWSAPPDSIELKLNLARPTEVFKVCLKENGLRISNYALVHDVAAQSKCNPDPDHAEIGQMIESLSLDPENGQLVRLLSKADYNWVEEELDSSNSTAGSSFSTAKEIEARKEYGVITTEEFNQLNSKQSKELELLNNPSVQIADFLSILSRGLLKTSLSIQESNEELLANLDIHNQTGEGGDVQQVLTANNSGEREAKAINRHFDKVYKFYSSQLKGLHNSKSFRSVPKRPLTIKDLSNISIALDLLTIYYGKHYSIRRTEFVIRFSKKYFDEIAEIEKRFKLYRVQKTNIDHPNWVYFDVDSEQFTSVHAEFSKLDPGLWVSQDEYVINTHNFEYIPSGVYNSEEGYGLKYYLIEMLGSFLLNANALAGYKAYDYDVLNEKVLSLRKSIFEGGVFLCLNLKWKESEKTWRNILLLDLLIFIYPGATDSTSLTETLKELAALYDKAKYKHSDFDENFSFFKTQLISNYLKNNNLLSKEPAESVRVTKPSGMFDLIFSKEIGFAFLKGTGKDYITTEKPGFEWDYDINANVLKLGYPPSLIKQ